MQCYFVPGRLFNLVRIVFRFCVEFALEIQPIEKTDESKYNARVVENVSNVVIN